MIVIALDLDNLVQVATVHSNRTPSPLNMSSCHSDPNSKVNERIKSAGRRLAMVVESAVSHKVEPRGPAATARNRRRVHADEPRVIGYGIIRVGKTRAPIRGIPGE